MGKTKISLIKHTFFNNSSKKIAFSFKEEDFVLDRLKYEFSSLYQVLLSNKNHLGEEHLVMEYLYYLCNVLISYYEMDYVGSDLQQFKQFRKEIEAYYQHNSFHKNQIPTHHFPDFMREIGHTRFEDFFLHSPVYRGYVTTWAELIQFARSFVIAVVLQITRFFIFKRALFLK